MAPNMAALLYLSGQQGLCETDCVTQERYGMTSVIPGYPSTFASDARD